MNRLILPILALALAAPFAGRAQAQLSGPDRELFVSSSIKGCNMTAEREKLPVPADKMNAFCACMAGKQADMTTPADLAYYAAHQSLSDDYSRRIQALGPDCRDKAGIAK